MARLNRLVYVLLAAGMLLAVLLMARQGLANAYHFKAVFYLDNWAKAKPVTPAHYADAKRAAEAALRLDPLHPDYYLVLARTLEWGALAGVDTLDSSAYEHYYQTAIRLRPSWPDTYTAYAYALARHLDQPVKAAGQLLVANRLGPYMPEPLMMGVQLAKVYWPVLPLDFKMQFYKNQLKLAKAYHPVYRRFVAMSKNSPIQPLQCNYLRLQALTAAEFARLKRDLCHDWADRVTTTQ